MQTLNTCDLTNDFHNNLLKNTYRLTADFDFINLKLHSHMKSFKIQKKIQEKKRITTANF